MKRVVLSLIFLMLAFSVNAQNAKKDGESYFQGAKDMWTHDHISIQVAPKRYVQS